MEQVLVLYVPVLHAGYIKLFENYRDKKLYLLDQTVVETFPKLDIEIRAIPPVEMQQILSKSGYFSDVILADAKVLQKLGQQKNIELILSTEYLADQLIEKYFPKSRVKQELIFLRFDEKEVKKTRKEIQFTGEITESAFHQTVLKQALEISEKSSDWFLRPAAAIVIDGKVAVLAANKRMPTAQDTWMVGDPRMYVEYGSDTHLRTTLHAEQAVIARAAREGLKIEGADFYVTTFPCPDCCDVIAAAGLKTCYFIDGYSKLSSEDVFKSYGIKLVKVTLDTKPVVSDTDHS